MLKKIFTFTIIGILGAGVLAGCGGAASEQAVEVATTVTESVTLAAAKDEGSLAQSDSEVTTTSTTSQATSSDYILPDSDKRLLTESDLAGLSNDELRLARNEIFARRGRKFKEKELQDYYGSKSWYNPTIDSDDFNANSHKYLNDIEIKNVEFIKSVEDRNRKDEFFFYDSDTRLLTEADLEGMSLDDMRLARNEIFARKGRMFKEKELQDYYSSKSWYNPTIDSDDFNANVQKYLNETEIRNADFIKSIEDKLKSDDSEKTKVLSAVEGNWRTIANVGSMGKIEYTIKGDTLVSNFGTTHKITDVVRSSSCYDKDAVVPGEEGYMIIFEQDHYDVEYYYYYDNDPDFLELHWDDYRGHGYSGSDSLERIK